MNKRYPRYPDDADYTTNAPSYYDDLARKNKLIKKLAKRIWEYDKILADSLEEIEEVLRQVIDKIGEGFNEEIYQLLVKWVEDGTLDHIINETLMNKKADITWVEDQLKTKVDLSIYNEEIENILNELNKKQDIETFEIELTKILKLIQALNDLTQNRVHINNYDVDPTGQKDSYAGIKKALEELKNNQTLVLDNDAEYYLSETIDIIKDGKYTIEGNNSTFIINALNDTDGLHFSGKRIKELNVLTDITQGKNNMYVSNISGLEIGDLLYFTSDDPYNTSRSYYVKGGVFLITGIDTETNLITFSGAFPYDINNTLKVYAYKPTTMIINDLKVIGKNSLPNGRWGVCLEYSSKTRLTNVYSDNWEHCITSRYGYSPIFEHVVTRRSFFKGTKESYGLSIYTNTFAHIKNSDMYSGRHGFEVSGFENSFKTKIENSSVFSENEEFDLNTHQCSHDLIIDNVITGTVGLCAFSTLKNSQIGREQGKACASQIKSSQTADLSRFIIRNCRIMGDHTFNFRSDQYDNPSRFFGDFIMEDNEVTDRITLGVSLSSHRFNINSIILRNTNNVSTIFYYGSTINNFIYENSRFSTKDLQFLKMANNAVINRLALRNLSIYVDNSDFQFMELKNINDGYIDNCRFGSIDAYTTNYIYLSSHEEQVPFGELFITNTNLENIIIKIRIFKTLAISNVINVNLDGVDSLETYYPPYIETKEE